MQSYLQYRRLRATVQAQVDRDRARAGNASSALGDEHGPQDSPSTASDAEKVDLEKGGDRHGLINDANPAEAGETAIEQSHSSNSNEDPPTEAAEEKEEMPAHADDDDDDQDEARLDQQRTLSRVSTQKSSGTGLGNALTGIDVRRRTTGEGGSGNVFVVDWHGLDDPNSPHNWSSASQRAPCTILVAAIGCVVGIASSIDSSALMEASQEFGVSEVVESMATALYLVGFGVGALVAGPFSEAFGRNPIYIVTLLLYMIFIMASGLAPNIGAQLAFRFLAGFFGSTPLTCAGGSISDLWNPLERVYTFPIFANAAFA
nr:putative efflux pump kojt [Quercus suber]